MRTIHTKKRWNKTKLVLLTLGITSLGIAIAGAVLGNPFLIGGGVAGIFLLGGFAMNLKKPPMPGVV
jgi:hypothetical protein